MKKALCVLMTVICLTLSAITTASATFIYDIFAINKEHGLWRIMDAETERIPDFYQGPRGFFNDRGAYLMLPCSAYLEFKGAARKPVNWRIMYTMADQGVMDSNGDVYAIEGDAYGELLASRDFLVDGKQVKSIFLEHQLYLYYENDDKEIVVVKNFTTSDINETDDYWSMELQDVDDGKKYLMINYKSLYNRFRI